MAICACERTGPELVRHGSISTVVTEAHRSTKYVRNVPTAMATWAASGRAGRAHHGGDCFLRGSRSVDDRANFVLSIPAHRGSARLATSAHVTHWRIQNEGPISHRQAEQGDWRSWFKHRLDSSAHKGLGYHRRHVDEASESGGTAKVFVVQFVSSGSIPAWDLDQRHQSAGRRWSDSASIKFSGRGKDEGFWCQRAFRRWLV